jgi:glucosamine 6-phosphate synthetase-like amidotransferase/phosphosugar isomerase protein
MARPIVVKPHTARTRVEPEGKSHNITATPETLTMPRAICEPGTLEQIEKGGYPHFMIKEIMEQPTSMANCMR